MATSLHLNHTFYHRFTPTSHMSRNLNFYRRFSSSFSWKARVLTLKKKHYRGTGHGVFSSSIIKANNTNNTEIDEVSVQEEKENEMERPPFDINLAVVLAGFAFEAYTSLPENVGKREVDAADCKTVYLSESFVREIYDGQLFIKLKKGFDLPAMDPWGTSDPYVVMELDGQVVKSKVKWGKKKPTWNEDFTVNIKLPPTKNLQIAAWDANLVTPHKRMGNTSIGLESLCDGNLHEVVVELEGMGGGGKLQLEEGIGRDEAKVEQWTETIQDTANAACRDSTSAGAQSTGDSAQLEKDQSAGFLQQTGEQVKHVAQDAMDSVKNTLGIGQNKK